MATVGPGSIRQPQDLRADSLASILGTWPEPALLESGPGFGDAGRWSILTARPRLVFEATGTAWSVRNDTGAVRSGDDRPLDALARLINQFGLADPSTAPDPALPPFQGGLIGFLGYDLAPLLERLPRKAPRASRIPDVRFALHDQAVTVDHATGAVDLWTHDLLGEGPGPTEHRAREWRVAIERQSSSPPRRSRLGPLRSNFTEADYLADRKSVV